MANLNNNTQHCVTHVTTLQLLPLTRGDNWLNLMMTLSRESCCLSLFYRIVHIVHALISKRLRLMVQLKISQRLHAVSKWQCNKRLEVHLTPNTISAKMQTWSCSKSDLTFFRNICNFFEQQYNLKVDTLCLMTELVRGMGLFPIWRRKLFCMHVHKELMPCKWVCDVKSRIEQGPC